MLEKFSQWTYEGYTPESKRGLIGEWVISIALLSMTIYAFNSNAISDGPNPIELNPVFAAATILVGVIIGFTVAITTLQSERFREVWADNTYRFVITFILVAAIFIPAYLSDLLTGYLLVGATGMGLAAAITRTILYIRGAEPT